MAKVILIEDDLTMLSLLRTLLEMEGYMVAKLKDEENITDILATMKLEKPDLALMDVHLPQINGYDLVRHIRKDPELRDMRIIMTSGLDVHEECLKAGANDFILKPYMPDHLIRLIRENLALIG